MSIIFFDPLSGERIAFNFDFGHAMTLRHKTGMLAPPAPLVGSDWNSATSADLQHEDAELPEGLSQRADGRYFADCCCCGRDCDVTEFADESDVDFTRWYGGCGPGCCP